MQVTNEISGRMGGAAQVGSMHFPWNTYEASLKGCEPLARDAEDGLTRELHLRPSKAVEERLIRANLRLVVRVVRQCVKPADRLYMDLIQEGNAGLVEAVRRFDPTKGVKLSTYATYWIRAYVYRHLMANWRLVKIGSTQRQRDVFFHTAERRRRDDPEVDLLVEHLSNPELSTEATVAGASDGMSFGETLPAPEEDRPDRQVEELQVKEWFGSVWAQFVEGLDARDRAILEARGLGLQRDDGSEPASLASIGRDLQLTRERVRQIEARIQTQFIAFARTSLGHH